MHYCSQVQFVYYLCYALISADQLQSYYVLGMHKARSPAIFLNTRSEYFAHSRRTDQMLHRYYYSKTNEKNADKFMGKMPLSQLGEDLMAP